MLRITIALGLMAVPALGQSFDLPHLTWPTPNLPPIIQGSDAPSGPVAPPRK